MSLDEFLTDLYDFVPAASAASWAAARTAGLCFAVYFVCAMLLAPFQLGIQMRLGDFAGILISGLIWVPVVTIISLCITIPVTLIVGGLCHLLLRTSRWYSEHSFGAGGFVTGVVLWTLLTRGAPPGHFIFGTVLSALTIGGPAGFIAGKTFARRMMTG